MRTRASLLLHFSPCLYFRTELMKAMYNNCLKQNNREIQWCRKALRLLGLRWRLISKEGMFFSLGFEDALMALCYSFTLMLKEVRSPRMKTEFWELCLLNPALQRPVSLRLFSVFCHVVHQGKLWKAVLRRSHMKTRCSYSSWVILDTLLLHPEEGHSHIHTGDWNGVSRGD